MRILIDATPLLLRSAGVKNYTYYWIQSLWEQARNDRILTLPALASLGPLNHERSIAASTRTLLHLGRIFAANSAPSLPLAATAAVKVDTLLLNVPVLWLCGCVPCLESDPVSSQEH